MKTNMSKKQLNPNELQKMVDKQQPEVKKIPMREIVIETDGTNINVKKSECSTLEMITIFASLLQKLQGK